MLSMEICDGGDEVVELLDTCSDLTEKQLAIVLAQARELLRLKKISS